MKYFFLSDSWTTGRVWEFGGLWNELAWNRRPHLQRQSLYIRENGEDLWLYQTEDAVLMVEVEPQVIAHPNIGQVVLKRLLSAEQVVERLCKEPVFHPPAASDDADMPPEAHPDMNTQQVPFQLANPSQTSSEVIAHGEKTVSVISRLRQLAGGKRLARPKAQVPEKVVSQSSRHS